MVAIQETFKLRPGTLADCEAAAEMLNAVSRAEIGSDNHGADEIRHEWTAPNFDVTESVRLAVTPDGCVVGLMEVWDTQPVPARVFSWGRVHPDYEGQGIGTALMSWAETRARRAIARVPDDVRVLLQSSTLSTNTAAAQLLTDQGLALVRHYWTMKIEMESAPPAPTWPEGITVRSLRRGEEERAVIAAFIEAFRDHWGFVEPPLETALADWQHRIDTNPDFDPDLWLLALDGDEIAALALCDAKTIEDPDMGWVNILAVRRPWRRRGLALALLQHTFGEFWRRDQRKVGLGVDASSITGATRLYEKAGMYVDRQSDLYEKELRAGRDIRVAGA